MSKINDGGPAFPAREYNDSDPQGYPTIYMPGMTLRDYFAAKAMQSFCIRKDRYPDDPDKHAERAYEMADAMLEARAEGKS